MKINGYIDLGPNSVEIQTETVAEFQAAVAELVAAAPAHFEAITQIKQAAIAAEVLSKPVVETKSEPVNRTKSTAPPNANKKADKDGCRHGPWTVFEEGKYQNTHYCCGPKDDKCSLQELKAAGIR